MRQVKEERLITLFLDPTHGLLRVACSKQLLIGRKLNDLAPLDQRDLKSELVTSIKYLPCLLLAFRCRDIVATRCSKVLIKSTLQRGGQYEILVN